MVCWILVTPTSNKHSRNFHLKLKKFLFASSWRFQVDFPSSKNGLGLKLVKKTNVTMTWITRSFMDNTTLRVQVTMCSSTFLEEEVKKGSSFGPLTTFVSQLQFYDLKKQSLGLGTASWTKSLVMESNCQICLWSWKCLQ